MRLRLLAASLAAALAVALCAVPAFADDLVLAEVTYPEYSVTYPDEDAIGKYAVGVSRTQDGFTLYVLSNYGYPVHPANHVWSYKNANGTWINTGTSDTNPFTITDAYFLQYHFTDYRCPVLTEDGEVGYIVFHLTSIGDTSDMSGVFGSTGQGIQQSVGMISTWIDCILDEPILLFFCLGLPLLTIGITIIRRMLATRA